jgi:hypothetical protein
VNRVGRELRPGVVRVGVLPVVEPFCTGFVWDGARLRRPVELASYEADLVRGRGVLSLLWFNRFVFYYHWLWVPHTVGTDTRYYILRLEVVMTEHENL